MENRGTIMEKKQMLSLIPLTLSLIPVLAIETHAVLALANCPG